ncbi:hypothetical protein TRAPUB_777 [Trametes pubescens]|uniref:DUF6535 domain-containing protein n=1 Tax=Trametes pubescens TaxID=154538 RepID=A0A1M2VL52_TRAPU|nr:hypothetical protein TRAPUB_777 [Trametes pubescens]
MDSNTQDDMLNSLTRHQGASETDPVDDVDPDFPSHQEVVPRPGSSASTNVATLGDADIDAPSEDGREETGKQQQEEEEIEIDEQKEAENADSEGGATTGQGPVVADEPKWDLRRREDQRAAAEAWTKCTDVMKGHHEAILARWKDEIDTLLVYAGLFSAVLTAFNVESYSLLQQNPTDTTNALLAQLSAQINSFTINSSFANSTLIVNPSPSSFQAARSYVWINALWFSSLICSLSAASIGMMVKQWLHENALGLAGTSRQTIRLRQYRYDALVKWHVGTIVAVLPLLLLFASAFFFAGLLILLWTLHHGVAAVASALVATLVVFAVTTILAPAFSSDCAYRSPQSLAVFNVVQIIRRSIGAIRSKFHWQPQWYIPNGIRLVIWICSILYAPASYHLRRIRDFLLAQLEPCQAWLVANLRDGWDRYRRFIITIRGLPWFKYSVWSDLELGIVMDRKHDLDQRAIEAVHALVLQDKFTDQVLRPCIRTLPPGKGHMCIQKFRQDKRDREMGVHHRAPSGFSMGIHAALIFDIMETNSDTAHGRSKFDQIQLFKKLIDDLKEPPLTTVGLSYAAWVSTPERLYRTLARLIRKSLETRTYVDDICRIADTLLNWEYLWSLNRLDLLNLPGNPLPVEDLRSGGLLLNCGHATRQRFVEDRDQTFVLEHLLGELKNFEDDISNEDRFWGEQEMEPWLNFGKRRVPQEGLVYELGVTDAHTQTDSTIPIDAGVPDPEDGLISRGFVVFLPHIITKLLLRLPPGSVTSRLTGSMKRIMDDKTNIRRIRNYMVYYFFLGAPWNALHTLVNGPQVLEGKEGEDMSMQCFANLADYELFEAAMRHFRTQNLDDPSTAEDPTSEDNGQTRYSAPSGRPESVSHANIQISE